MRIPYSKPYRAFPELDPFSDAQCRMMLQMAKTRQPAADASGCLSSGSASVLMLVSMIVLLRYVLIPLSRLIDHIWRYSDARESLELLVASTLVVGVPWMSALLVRDHLMRKLIGGVLAHGATCIQCRYSLLGLPELTDGRVRCPECGHTNVSDPALRALVTPQGARE